MPVILSEESVIITWDDIALSESRSAEIAARILSTGPRTPGVHLSGITRHMALSTGLLKPFRVGSTQDIRNGEMDEEEMPLRMMLGMAYERWVAGLYPEMEWQPGELSKDGIVGSMDGFTIEDYGTVVDEFKLTWKSSYQPFLSKKNQLWLWQGMGYAHMMETRWVRWHVLYVNGDYRLGGCGEPEYRKILVEFSQKELEGNWRRLVMNRDEEGVVKE